MSEKYTYQLTSFPDSQYNISNLTKEIQESNITIALDYINGFEEYVDIYFKDVLGSENLAVLDIIVSNHDYENINPEYDQVEIVSTGENLTLNTNLSTELRDRSGKLRIHDTPRKIGLKTYWTGCGDDINISDDIGNGTSVVFNHNVGDSTSYTLYIDFNCQYGFNESWVFEGYLHWINALNDLFTWEMVSTVVPIETGLSGTNYNLYNGYLIIPAAGNGTINILSDITLSNGGLVYAPLNDLGQKSAGFWDATWNSSTQRYEDITPTPDGSGWYNMFATEITFARFMNKLPLLGSNSMRIQAFDIDELGQGVRFKAIWETKGEDHNWMSCGWVTMFRKKTI